MFCQKCGKQLPQSSMFCAYCGTKQEAVETAPQSETDRLTEDRPTPQTSTPVQADSATPKSKKRMIFLISLGAAVVVLAVILIAYFSPPVINPNLPSVTRTLAPPANTTTPPSGGDESEEKNNAFASASVGDMMQFGGYDWRVLDVRGGRALILSNKILRIVRYHDRGIEISWSDCSLRQWLNGEFYDTWFSAQERSRVVETQIETADNPWYGTMGCGITSDKIFLLSLEEVVRYFGDSGQLGNRPSGAFTIDDQYNSARIARYDTAGALWWLRSPGYGGDKFAATSVNDSGVIGIAGGYADVINVGVRPAMWISLDDATLFPPIESSNSVQLPKNPEDFPKLTDDSCIVDYANILEDGYSEAAGTGIFPWIESINEELSANSGEHIIVATISSLNGAIPAEYTEQLLNDWEAGSSWEGKGMLLLLTPNDGQAAFVFGSEIKSALMGEYGEENYKTMIESLFSTQLRVEYGKFDTDAYAVFVPETPFSNNEYSFWYYFNSKNYVDAVGSLIDNVWVFYSGYVVSAERRSNEFSYNHSPAPMTP